MAQIDVYLDRPRGTIRRGVYGHFAEHLGTCIYEGLWVGEDSAIANTDGLRNDVLAALRRIKPTVIRWPGGCFADTYHWEDGVGPREERPRRVNVWWGEGIETNAFGTHEFIKLCGLLGAEPYVCGNVGSGTPAELAGWVEYCNFAGDSTLARHRRANGADAPFGVTYWGVGNENWGCGGNLEPEDYAVEYRRFATFLHDFSGHRNYLIACGPSGNDTEWTRRFFTKLGTSRRPHGFAAHYYCGTAGTATEFTSDEHLQLVHRAAEGMERLVLQQRAILDGFDPRRQIDLIVDEWGTWHPADPDHPPRSLWQQNTVRDALVAADTLNVFNRHADKVAMANIAQMINVLQAMVLTDGDRMAITPTGHVYELFADHQGAESLDVAVDSEPVGYTAADGRDASLPQMAAAASRSGERLLVTFTHRALEGASEVVVRLRGGSANGASARVLAHDDPRAHNTFDAPDEVAPRPLPASAAGDTVRLTVPANAVVALTIGLS